MERYRIKYGGGFSRNERKKWQESIREQLLQSMSILIRAAARLHIDFADENHQVGVYVSNTHITSDKGLFLKARIIN